MCVCHQACWVKWGRAVSWRVPSAIYDLQVSLYAAKPSVSLWVRNVLLSISEVQHLSCYQLRVTHISIVISLPTCILTVFCLTLRFKLQHLLVFLATVKLFTRKPASFVLLSDFEDPRRKMAPKPTIVWSSYQQMEARNNYIAKLSRSPYLPGQESQMHMTSQVWKVLCDSVMYWFVLLIVSEARQESRIHSAHSMASKKSNAWYIKRVYSRTMSEIILMEIKDMLLWQKPVEHWSSRPKKSSSAYKLKQLISRRSHISWWLSWGYFLLSFLS